MCTRKRDHPKNSIASVNMEGLRQSQVRPSHKDDAAHCIGCGRYLSHFSVEELRIVNMFPSTPLVTFQKAP